MKYPAKIIILTLFACSANAQQKGNIIIGIKDTIYSETLGESRALWVYTPGLTASGPEATTPYPVLFVLDGGAHFYSTAGIIQQLSQANGNGILPEMTIVGIESTDRFKDFIPAINTSGTLDGANLFLKFLAGELIPFIDKKYNAASYRMLVGHSLGGLLTMDILCNYPDLFNAYLAIEPSMWYAGEQFLNQDIAAVTKQKFTNTRLFVGVANTLPEGMTLSNVKNDTTAGTKHIRALFRLDDFLRNNTIAGLKYEQKYYENENHNSVPLISEYDGLRFIFDYYRLNATEKDFADTTSVLAFKIRSHYTNIAREMGYTISPPEAVIQYFGYDALARKHYEKAEALFKLNIDHHPESDKACEAYADYFAAKKDTANAIKYYKRALLKNGHSKARDKLNALLHPGAFSVTDSDLQKYAAVYTLLPYNIDVEFYIKENKLWAKVPGQADEELIPVSQDVFTLKDKQGYTITFNADDSRKIISFTSVQPEGTFKAVLKQ